jgi:hypothetical protein
MMPLEKEWTIGDEDVSLSISARRFLKSGILSG